MDGRALFRLNGIACRCDWPRYRGNGGLQGDGSTCTGWKGQQTKILLRAFLLTDLIAHDIASDRLARTGQFDAESLPLPFADLLRTTHMSIRLPLERRTYLERPK